MLNAIFTALRNLGMAGMGVLLAFLIPMGSEGADVLSILDFSIDAQGNPRATYTAQPDQYYILYRATQVTDSGTAVSMTLGSGAAELVDPLAWTSHQSAFYRIIGWPINTPQDLDLDGMDDVYELRHPRFLNPFDPLDAALDFDRDMRSNRDEYIAGTDPEVSEFATPTVKTLPASTAGSSFVIIGTARLGVEVRVVGGTSEITGFADADGGFSLDIPLLRNQVNQLSVVAVNSAGEPSAPWPVKILQDSLPPSLYVDFPTNNTILHSADSVVAGRVGDLLSGFQGMEVYVHASPAEGTSPALGADVSQLGGAAHVDVGIGNNGTYERSLTPLVEGTNTVTVTAFDSLRNGVQRQIQIVRAPLNGPRIQIVSGDLQKTNVHRRVAKPLVVRATQADGVTPIVGKALNFQVTRSDGRVQPVTGTNIAAFLNDVSLTLHGVLSWPVVTDAQGEARVYWALGGDAGCGNNRVCVSADGISNRVYFCASAAPAAVNQINVGSGSDQKEEVGAFLPLPLSAWVNDSCNGIEGIPVTFTVIQGGAKLFSVVKSDGASGSDTLTVISGRTGHADVSLQLGTEPGQTLVEATYPNNPRLPATFISYGVQRDANQPTRLNGLVLDNTSQPVGNALVELFRPNVGLPEQMTYTDTQGRFGFTNAPTGPVHLFVYGASANSLGGVAIPTNSFPFLTYPITLIPNAANSLPKPILLPRLNPKNAVTYYGTNDLVLTCEGMDGLKMTIKAGSMRDARGIPVTVNNPAVVSLNQVHHDQIPMPIPDGASPPFAWTLQPARATFDPPVDIEYPNMSGLPAGTIAYFLSFNHDTERFEIVSSGHVDAQGALIHTDPGAGLTVAGWGCNCPQYAVTGDCKKCPTPSQQSLPLVSDYVFRDAPFTPVTFSVSPDNCGQVQINYERHAYCDCDSSNDGKNTRGRAQITVSVYAKTYWDRIIDPQDIAFVLEHENRHVALAKEFFDERVVEASGFNGKLFPSETACEQAALNFRANFDNMHGLLDYNQKAQVDTASDIAKCAEFIAKYRIKDPVILSGLNDALPQPEYIGTRIDDTWDFSVNGQVIQSELVDQFRVRGISAVDLFGPGGPGSRPDFLSDDYFRVIGHSTAGGTNRYAISDYFQIKQGETTFINDLIFTDVPPRKAESLSIVVSNHTVVVGQDIPLTVMARYADGSETNVSSRSKWTSYRVSNPSIATVTPDGVVKPLRAGVVYVTAVNEGASSACGLNVVVQNSGLTTVTGLIVGPDSLPAAGTRVLLDGIVTPNIVSDAAGRFAIKDVPASLGPIFVLATNSLGPVVLYGTAYRISPIPGGFTDAGTIALRPIRPVVALKSQLERYIMTQSNETQQMTVFAVFSDGATEEIRGVASGLQYSILSGTAALVSSNGVITAIRGGLGHVSVRARRGLLSTTNSFDVASLDALTLVRGKVVDTNGSPVAHTAVSLYGLATPAGFTEADGSFAFTNVPTKFGALYVLATNTLGPITLSGASMPLVPVPGAVSEAGVLVLHKPRKALSIESKLSELVMTQVNQTQQLHILATFDDGSVEEIAGPPAGLLYTVSFGSSGVSVNVDGQIKALSNGAGSLDVFLSNTPLSLTRRVDVSIGDSLTTVVGNLMDRWGQAVSGATVLVKSSATSPVLTDLQGRFTIPKIATLRGPISVLASNAVFAEISLAQLFCVTPIAGGFTDVGTLTVSPPTTLIRLEAYLDKPFLSSVGETTQLRTRGEYDDGQVLSLGCSSSGNLYKSSDTKVASVDANGVITAVAAGHVVIVVSNSGVQTSVALDVIPVSRLTTLRGRIVDTNGFPLRGVVVRVWDAYALSQKTGDDGMFTLERVPVPATQIDISARAVVNGHVVVGLARVQGVAGGVTEIGDLLAKFRQADKLAQFGIGGRRSFAIREDGTIWAWGSNGAGYLGDSTTNNADHPVPILSNRTWSTLAVGSDHTLAICDDGSLWAWGGNDFGQLGDGTRAAALVPRPVKSTAKWRAVSAGGFFSLAIRDDGTLWSWGRNLTGELGNGGSGSAFEVSEPQPIAVSDRWLSVSAGGHVLAIRDDGTLWSWGGNFSGELGLGYTTSPSNPVQNTLPKLVRGDLKWQWVSAGSGNSAAILDDGTLWSWGSNSSGQLGLGSVGGEHWVPEPVAGESRWRSVVVGAAMFAVRVDGTLWSWGGNTDGLLGIGTSGSGRTYPQAILSGANWIAVANYGSSTLAMQGDGSIWSWGGRDDRGELGHGIRPSLNIPRPVDTNQVWTAVAAGNTHSLALRSDGTLWKWGYDGSGGEVTHVPHTVTEGTNWTTFAAGSSYSLAIQSDGSLWAWGVNSSGGLGAPNLLAEYSTDVPIRVLADAQWTAVAASLHTVAVRGDGSLWTWGLNRFGQLANGSALTGRSPDYVKIPGTALIDQPARKVAAGLMHTLILGMDGRIRSAGNNLDGELGLGFYSVSSINTPREVVDASLWIQVEAGSSFSLGLRSDGSLWSWGRNTSGQLGIGTFIRTNAPVPVLGDHKWKAISAGASHVVAISDDGSLWSWGANSRGELGYGWDSPTKVPSIPIPHRVLSGDRWIAVSAGSQHTLAIREDGTLWAWGLNVYGQAGQLPSWTPGPVIGGAAWVRPEN